MYKAIKEIGGYKIGEEIPTEQAMVWMDMYAEPHVELVSDESNQDDPETVDNEIDNKPENDSNDNMLDDYLARKGSVVKKNILNDGLSKSQLEKLLGLEKLNKNRSAVIKSIKEGLKKFEE